MADIAKLVEDLSKLTVLEAADLAKALEEAWGVSAAAAVAVAAPAAGGDAGGAAAEEQTEFDVIRNSPKGRPARLAAVDVTALPGRHGQSLRSLSRDKRRAVPPGAALFVCAPLVHGHAAGKGGA
jgi:large subunit ribosomal protein L7/L12